MYLKLTTPYNPGMNDAGNTYPCLYITQLTNSVTGKNFSFIYEAGSFVDVEVKDTDGNVLETVTTWAKGPGMLSQMAQVDGDEYAKAIASPAIKATDTPYQAIYRILYYDLMKLGFAGTIVDT